jgi:outer membrane protein OmpA-like peptidoglycan-associated protein
MIWLFATDDIKFDIVEVGPLPAALQLTLPKPAAKPETIVPEKGDFPYLPAIPGTTSTGGSKDDSPMLIEVDTGKGESETRVAAPGSITKTYSVPQRLSSPATFFYAYHDPLLKAGWTIVHQSPNVTSADAVISAHYTANGRDLWVYLHGGGDSISIQVGDAGAQDLAKQLDQDCHVALYGINFDFNKSTLRPDSDPTLEKVLALLRSRPDLKLEVQGHTDNIGADDYNLKLSDARASSVVAWLVSKGIAADRLTAHGYGMRQPIADNGSDEGRAKNRRVELRKQGCAK